MSTAMPSSLARSARKRSSARRVCAKACRWPRSLRRKTSPTRKSTCLPAGSPAAAFWSTGSGRPAARRRLSIEPQISGLLATARNARQTRIRIVLSRFAYLRRRGSDLVLESPRSPALFRIADPKIAAAILALSTPRKISALRQSEKDFVGLDAACACSSRCEILFKVDGQERGLARARGRPEPRGLGFSRSPVPYPLDRRPPGQCAGRTLSLCRHDRAAAGRAARHGMASRSICQAFSNAAEAPRRRFAALLPRGIRSVISTTQADHAGRARAFSRLRRTRADRNGPARSISARAMSDPISTTPRVPIPPPAAPTSSSFI